MAEKKGASGEKVLVLLLLRQEPARGEEAHCRAVGVHLRRVHRAVQRHHPRRGAGRRRAGQVRQVRPADPQRDQDQPRRLRDRPGSRQAHAVGGGLQPLQAPEACRRFEGRGRADQEQHPADRPHRLGQDAAGADAGQAAERALRHRRRHHADRSRLRGRGCREHHPEAAAELQLRRRAGAARHRLHRRDRQDRAQERTTRRSRATCRAKACSRRCSS